MMVGCSWGMIACDVASPNEVSNKKLGPFLQSRSIAATEFEFVWVDRGVVHVLLYCH